MEDLICLDSSVLIDFYRKKKKETTFFYKLSTKYDGFILPVVTHFEILIGSNKNQHLFWHNLFGDFIIAPYVLSINTIAIKIAGELKLLRKTIEYKDLIIAATAIQHKSALLRLMKKILLIFLALN